MPNGCVARCSLGIFLNIIWAQSSCLTQVIKKNSCHESDELASFIFGDEGFVIHFFKDDILKENGVKGELADLSKGNQVIFTISAETEA
ncbi:hypothetical protein [Dyadobacter sp. CY323]|uniref:hypothetical protein n=1 Tax=Dyadobacter sp. CY323 TaxID=2907302 RepID=UPI001F1EA945|nr:hypothetical protein [Dyadobacter sp. CY323]MCE6988638.1 hypothetical protein [Dyadobacter sp. CY323]